MENTNETKIEWQTPVVEVSTINAHTESDTVTDSDGDTQAAS
jgi:hypothetical protein